MYFKSVVLFFMAILVLAVVGYTHDQSMCDTHRGMETFVKGYCDGR